MSRDNEYTQFGLQEKDTDNIRENGIHMMAKERHGRRDLGRIDAL